MVSGDPFGFLLKLVDASAQSDLPPSFRPPFLLDNQTFCEASVVASWRVVADTGEIIPTPLLVSKETRATASSGLIRFTNMVVQGRPASFNRIRLTCRTADEQLAVASNFEFRIAPCLKGFEPVSQGFSCVPCVDGWYSDGGDDACVSCPSVGAKCEYGMLSLLDGFYVPPRFRGYRINASTELHACAIEGACLVNSTSREFLCLEGYTGPLCGVCDEANGFVL
jgi:hypothetical protein